MHIDLSQRQDGASYISKTMHYISFKYPVLNINLKVVQTDIMIKHILEHASPPISKESRYTRDFYNIAVYL